MFGKQGIFLITFLLYNDSCVYFISFSLLTFTTRYQLLSMLLLLKCAIESSSVVQTQSRILSHGSNCISKLSVYLPQTLTIHLKAFPFLHRFPKGKAEVQKKTFQPIPIITDILSLPGFCKPRVSPKLHDFPFCGISSLQRVVRFSVSLFHSRTKVE